MSDLLVSVQKLFERREKFDGMNPAQKAAFRATVSRYLKMELDPEVKDALLALQENVGKGEVKAAAKLTVEDLESEFQKNFSGYNVAQRGAYKAKVQRLLNEADKAGDADTKQRLEAIKGNWLGAEQAAAKSKILELSQKLVKPQEKPQSK